MLLQQACEVYCVDVMPRVHSIDVQLTALGPQPAAWLESDTTHTLLPSVLHSASATPYGSAPVPITQAGLTCPSLSLLLQMTEPLSH